MCILVTPVAPCCAMQAILHSVYINFNGDLNSDGAPAVFKITLIVLDSFLNMLLGVNFMFLSFHSASSVTVVYSSDLNN